MSSRGPSPWGSHPHDTTRTTHTHTPNVAAAATTVTSHRIARVIPYPPRSSGPVVPRAAPMVPDEDRARHALRRIEAAGSGPPEYGSGARLPEGDPETDPQGWFQGKRKSDGTPSSDRSILDG
ncbi:hypothetical protein GCM10010497_04980 [Streptomyces cinereoruber]|uniref:ATP-grasp-modified RiPP n=1 Tax=Streptomyces cinereoruber TaxID=67260 RepID=A0AAV4KF36_9ACTN|nr:hypothetical protein GCM10010497_04980 [Streptomyces cinereoruber]